MSTAKVQKIVNDNGVGTLDPASTAQRNETNIRQLSSRNPNVLIAVILKAH
jgi:hypothetical protein